ncbi:hypothetical protein Pcac1_g17380 [Phytophthora cactorum]|nr:hypothetical protein Pcac1_g17380 [Phytophthora cactorum]
MAYKAQVGNIFIISNNAHRGREARCPAAVEHPNLSAGTQANERERLISCQADIEMLPADLLWGIFPLKIEAGQKF